MGTAECGCSVRIMTGRVLEFEAPSSPKAVSRIRSRVAQFARGVQFSEDDIEDIKLAVGEACTNAVRHGASAHCCFVTVRVETQPDAVRIVVSDKGCGFDPTSIKVTAAGSLIQSGRGILLMRALVDEVKIHFGNPGTSVELVKYVRSRVGPQQG